MSKLYLKAVLVTAVVGAIVVAGFYFWRAKTMPTEKVGSLALLDQLEKNGMIDFSGKDLNGKKVAFTDYKGNLVILNFWASWCSPCIEELPSLVKLVEEFKGKVKLVAVSADSSEVEMREFLKAFPQMKSPDITIVWDSDKKIMENYEVSKLPESFIAGQDFKLVKKIVGTINWHTPDSVAYIKKLLGE